MSGLPPTLRLSTLVSALCVIGQLHATDTMRFNYDGYVQYNSITGNSPSSSMLTSGWVHHNLFSLYLKGVYEGFDYNINAGVKLTNDRRKDIKGISLLNLAGVMKNENHTLDLGDFFKSYSKYSLSTSLKGASYTYTTKDKDTFNLSYGLAYPRWDNFWDDEADSTEREVLGVRYNKNLTEALSVGFDLVKTEDSNSKVANIPLYETTLYTLNTTYKPIPGLKIYSEYSFSENETDNGTSTINKNGSAFFLQAIGNKNPSRVQLEYERISPNFKTVTGSATADREKIKSTWRYKITNLTTMNSGFLWFRDNLENSKTNTTHTYRPNFGFTFKQLFERRYAVVDVNSKLNIIESGNTKTYDKMFDINYRDRFDIVYSDMNFAYNIYDTNNNGRKQNEFRFNSTLSTRHTYNDFVIKPSWIFGTWDMSDELTNNQDSRYYQNALGLGFDIPRYKITTNLKVGYNTSTRESGDDLDKMFGSFDAYWKLGKIESFKDVMLYTKASINDFSYTTSSNDYQEKSITLGVKMTF